MKRKLIVVASIAALICVVMGSIVGCQLQSVPGELEIPTLQEYLIIHSDDYGSVTTPGEGGYNYTHGAVVDLVAIPIDETYVFVSWSGDVDTIADIYDATTTIRMNGDYCITANFGYTVL